LARHHLLHQLVTEGHWLRAAKHVIDLKRVSGEPLTMTLTHKSSALTSRPGCAAAAAWQGIGAGPAQHVFCRVERKHRSLTASKKSAVERSTSLGDPFDRRVRLAAETPRIRP